MTIPLKPSDFHADIVVAGAGPAGVALAMRLKRLAYDVVLATATANAAHTFEILNPGAQEQLAFEGLSAGRGVAAEFEIRWRPGDFERRAQPSTSFLVDRRTFHAELRRSAVEAGIRTLDGRAESPEKAVNGWRLRIGTREASARLLVDATGRRGMTAAVRRRGPPLIGLHASWIGERLPSAVRVAASRDSWVWGAPKPDGGYTTSVFQDARLAKAGGGRVARIDRIVAQSGILEGAAHAELAGDVAASNSTPHVAFAQEQLSLFRIGDAALALDPISSSGVQVALQSAVDAALAIHTLREDPGAGAMVESFLERRLERRAARHAAWTMALYGEAAKHFATPFWTGRAGAASPAERLPPPAPDQPVGLGTGVRLQDEPCPVGDRISMRRVVAPPGAAEPVAIVDGIEIAPLFALISPGATVVSLLRQWSTRIGEDQAFRLVGWAWRAGLLGPQGSKL
jgi:2-polyprenyl-6-methoxyphenol hydroxylase-like FAD-dependent oxidoreductase